MFRRRPLVRFELLVFFLLLATIPFASAATTSQTLPTVGSFTSMTDPGCGACTVVAGQGSVDAAVPGGTDSADTAYGVVDFGGSAGWTGRTYVHDVIGLGSGVQLNGNLSVLQVRDVSDALMYELYVAPDRTLRVYSPSGGLTGGVGLNSSTQSVVPNNGSSIALDISAAANNSVVICVDGSKRLELTGLSGGTTTAARFLRVGIDHYDSASASSAASVKHTSVGVSTSGFIGSCAAAAPATSGSTSPASSGGGTSSAPTSQPAAVANTTSSPGDLNLDFENGTYPGRWGGLDSWAPAPGSTIDTRLNNSNRNFHVGTDHTLPGWGSYSARFEMSSTDNVSDGRSAVLMQRGDTNEKTGDDYWYSMAFYIPSSMDPNGELIWEIHDREAVDRWAAAHGLSNDVAPLALMIRRADMGGWNPSAPSGSPTTWYWTLRVNGGDGTAGGQMNGWNPLLYPLLPMVSDRWAKFMIHVRFSENSGGVVQVWQDNTSNTGPAAFPANPVVTSNGPNLKSLSAAGVSGLTNFQLLGIYRGRTPAGATQVLWTTGVRRRSSQAAAVASFGSGSGGATSGGSSGPQPPPPVPQPAPKGTTTTTQQPTPTPPATGGTNPKSDNTSKSTPSPSANSTQSNPPTGNGRAHDQQPATPNPISDASPGAQQRPSSPTPVDRAGSSATVGNSTHVESCATCKVTTKGGQVQAVVPAGGGAVSAYAVKDLGESVGSATAVSFRDSLRLPSSQRLGGKLWVVEVRDAQDQLLYALYIAPDRTLRLYSPAGGLQSTAVDWSTEKHVPVGTAPPMQVTVTGRPGAQLTVRINGAKALTLDSTGATAGPPRTIRFGITSYDGNASGNSVRVAHSGFRATVGAAAEAAGVSWGGVTFKTRAALTTWLVARGTTFARWAAAHPAAAARLP